MKIIKEKQENPAVAVTLRLPKMLLKKMTEVAEQYDVSRQRLIAEVLEQALEDKNFELKLKD